MRKFLCVVLLSVMCFSSTFVFAQNETENNETNLTENNQTTDLQEKQKEVQVQIDQTNDELSNLQIDMTENLEQIQKLDDQIEEAEKELQETSEQVATIQKTVKELEKNLEVEQKKYDEQRTIFEDRVVALYEAGETQYLDVILSSKSISEFISSYYVISEIAESDAEMLSTIAERKNNIESTNENLKKQKEQLSIMAQRETRTSNILKNTKAFKESYASNLSEKEKEAQIKLEEYKKALEDVEKQILELAKQGLDTVYIGGELAWPVPGYTKISSPYGMRTHPITHVYKLHTGVDISAPMGANFVAANDGVVVSAGYNAAYGNMVIIDHGGGISTLYGHGSKILVEVGQQVKRNEPILKVGSTGYSTGPHAHFEVRKNGTVTNPMPYITNGVVPNSKEDKEQEEKSNENTVAENQTN